MHSTVQLSSYMIPTSRTKPHPSQTTFDTSLGLMVKSLGPVASDATSLPRSRTQLPSSLSMLHASDFRSALHDSSTASRSATEPRWHSSKTGADRREPVCLSTATVSKSGLIALKPQTGDGGSRSTKETYEPLWRSKTSYGGMALSQGKRKLGWTAAVTVKDGRSTDFGGMTLGDLRGALDNSYPATNGFEFSRASAHVQQNITRLARHYEQVKAGAQPNGCVSHLASSAASAAAHSRMEIERQSREATLSEVPIAGASAQRRVSIVDSAPADVGESRDVDNFGADETAGPSANEQPNAGPLLGNSQAPANDKPAYVGDAQHMEQASHDIPDGDSMPERIAYSSSIADSDGGAADDDKQAG